MKEYDPVFPWSADGMTEEEISAKNLEIAEECELRGEKQEALRHYFIAADEGNDAKMQLFLANLYKDMADGKETDYPIDEPHPMEKAVEYYEKSAENGNIKALKIVIGMYKENAKKEAEETLKELIAEKVKEIIDSEIRVMAKGFYIVDGELLKYKGTDSYVTIPYVTRIGSYAFRGCTSLKEVRIPDSVTNIGNCAFSCCTSLEEVTIPDSVTSIDYGAFSVCTKLKEVTIPDSVTSIGNWAFKDCTSLKEVTISDSVKIIGSDAFYGCTSLEEVTIPDSVTSIDWCAFKGCTSLKEVTIPKNCKIKTGEASSFERYTKVIRRG
ncbi:MAG: leucine-rich repeat protein [Ruminococcus sp.]|nr:leucine-rich repeat protein [Ruminococcus sp.]